MPKLIDLSGQKIGRLLVVRKETAPMKRSGTHYVCHCDCGSVKTIHRSELRNGDTKSCGCIQREKASQAQYKHGLRHHPIYKTYSCMKDRCLNPRNHDYPRYGGRGISICESWLQSFENFANDMLPSWKPKLTLERVDLNKDYCPDNCIWAGAKQQANNRRTSVRVLFNGEQYTKEDFSKKFNIPLRTVVDRLSRGVLTKVYLYPDE